MASDDRPGNGPPPMPDGMPATVPDVGVATVAAPARRPKGEFESPVDLPQPADPATEPHPLRWTATAIATAAVLLALTNATALAGWARDLPPNPTSERIVTAAEGWYAFTDRVGLTIPGKTVRATYERIKAARFTAQPDAAPAPEGGDGA